MKKFLKTLLTLTLATSFVLSGCNTTDVSGENSSNTSEVSTEASSDTRDMVSSVVSEDSSAEVSSDDITMNSSDVLNEEEIDRISFSHFSLQIPIDMTVEGNTIFYNGIDVIKIMEIYPAVERNNILANAKKEYRNSEFFVRESEYTASALSWIEYTVQVPCEDEAVSISQSFSYYFLEYNNMIIKVQIRPSIFGLGGSQRDLFENILKTIK